MMTSFFENGNEVVQYEVVHVKCEVVSAIIIPDTEPEEILSSPSDAEMISPVSEDSDSTSKSTPVSRRSTGPIIYQTQRRSSERYPFSARHLQAHKLNIRTGNYEFAEFETYLMLSSLAESSRKEVKQMKEDQASIDDNSSDNKVKPRKFSKPSILENRKKSSKGAVPSLELPVIEVEETNEKEMELGLYFEENSSEDSPIKGVHTYVMSPRDSPVSKD
jgi:hypothetical protein